MSGGVARYVVLAVGGFQVLANAALLVHGLVRLPKEIEAERATPRMEDLLRHSWIVGVLANLCVSVLLVLLASGVRDGDTTATDTVSVIAAYYALLGVVAFAFGRRRHAGMLVFTVLGVLLAVAVCAR